MNTPDEVPESEKTDGSGQATETASHKLFSVVKEVVIVVVAALVISTLVKSFLFRAYVIPSGSMENTLQIQDRVFVNLLAPEVMDLHRGDVVVFKDDQGWLPKEQTQAKSGPVADALTFLGLRADDSTQHLVKRIIGMPGDTVECCTAEGALKVNGKAIKEGYLHPGSAPSDSQFKVVVPEGRIWVMGDHRDDSADSRAHSDKRGGFVNLSSVEGRASVIAWPLNRLGKVGGSGDTFKGIKNRPAKPYDPDIQEFANSPLQP